MPRKNSNARQHTATRVLQAVPDPTPGPTGRTAAEDKLWAALYAHPGTTTADLATHAGIGRSTTGKILAAWAGDGSATRTPVHSEGGRRSADTWTISDIIQDNGAEPAAAESASTGPATAPTAITNDTAGKTGGEETEAIEQGATEQAPGAETQRGTGAAMSGENGIQPTKGARLSKGALRGMVEDYLTEHSREQLSPSAIGKALSRSSGAVANALDKLVAEGYAVQTRDKPKRYAINATAAESATSQPDPAAVPTGEVQVGGPSGITG